MTEIFYSPRLVLNATRIPLSSFTSSWFSPSSCHRSIFSHPPSPHKFCGGENFNFKSILFKISFFLGDRKKSRLDFLPICVYNFPSPSSLFKPARIKKTHTPDAKKKNEILYIKNVNRQKHLSWNFFLIKLAFNFLYFSVRPLVDSHGCVQCRKLGGRRSRKSDSNVKLFHIASHNVLSSQKAQKEMPAFGKLYSKEENG